MKKICLFFVFSMLLITGRMYSQCSPTLITSGNTTLCTNFTNSVTLTATASPIGGTYSWSPGGGTGPVVSVTPTITTIYTVAVTYSNGCTATATVMVTVKNNCCTQTPTIITNGTQTLCTAVTNSVILTATASPIGGTYSWSPGGATGPTVAVTPTVNTFYTVTVTYSNGCQASSVVAVFVSTNCCTQTPTIVTSGNTTLCTNFTPTTVLSATATPGGGTYSWTPGGLGQSVVVSPTATTIYTVKVTYSTGCVATKTLMVTVLNNCCTQTPTIITNGTQTLCTAVTNSVILTATASPIGGTYSWSPGGATGPSVAVTPTVTTFYTVTVTYSNGCQASSVVAVFVSTNCCTQTPTIVTNGTQTLCTAVTNSVILTATASPIGGTYSWSPGGTTGPSVAVTPTVTTFYTVTVTYSNGCQASSVVAVFVSTNCCTQTPTLVTSGNTTLCTNSSTTVVLSATVLPASGASYSWTPGGSGSVVVVSPTTTTVYTLTVTYTTGCVATATLSVTVVTTCCPTSTISVFGSTTLNNTTVSGPVIILNDITVTGGVSTLQNGAFLMGPGVRITVDPGSQLDLNGAHLYACGLNMWDGIEVLDGGRITGAASGSQNTLIEDAVTAVLLDNVNSPATVPVDLDGVIFNKNHTSIYVGNGSVTSLNLRLRSCVFTSRNLPFTLTSWPGSSLSSPDLRYTTASALAGVAAPYSLQGYALSNLKIPYTMISARTGIYLKNMNNVAGNSPAAGVNINTWYAMADADFNLFDMVSVGIHAEDASLTTMNNVFQNMQTLSGQGGAGIYHNITGLMNARLSLTPQMVTPSLSNSNRFWECYYGIQVNNVYEFDMENGLIRSAQNTSGGGFVPGYKGISVNTNRFDYRINKNEFNNLNTALEITITDGNYDMGSGTIYGVYPMSVQGNENYFGPQVSSSTGLGSNYLNNAIRVFAPNSSSFAGSGTGVFFQSNKIDRAFRGISVQEMAAFPVDVSGNLINLTDDIMFSQPQFGIGIVKTLDLITVIENTLSAAGISNGLVSLVYCESNGGTNSPAVTCNLVTNGFSGFEFNRNNSSAVWQGNRMRAPLRRGLLLRNTGIIGVQGGPGAPSGNQWIGTWPAGNFGTYTDGSNASASVLYVGAATLPLYPPNNSGIVPATSYAAAGNLQVTGGTYACVSLGLPNPPSNRQAATQQESEITSEEGLIYSGTELKLYPNPAKDKLFIGTGLETEELEVNVYDLTGKKVHAAKSRSAAYKAELNLSLEQGIYLFEIRSGEQPIQFRKVVITN